MTQDNIQLVSNSAVRFLSGTFLSRCSGLLRDVSMAFCFGSHPAVAAFMVAFRFANLFRRLLGEGALPSSFIPHFATLQGDSPEKGFQFFRDLFFSLTVFLILFIAVIEGALFGLLKWNVMSVDSSEIISLIMLMLPGLLFICLFGLTSALLQYEKKFFLSGVSPIAFNCVWVGAVWWLRGREIEQAMSGLAVSVIIAFAMQWLMTIQGHWKLLLQRKKVQLFSVEMRRMIQPLFLSMIGVGAVQINSALDGLFARFASLEGPAYLWYAIRLEQVPLALFGIALSSALLPPLSRAIQGGEWSRYQQLLDYGLQRAFGLMMPCTVGVIVLGCAGVNLLYGRGDFSQLATAQTVICLWGYTLGLVPSVFVLLLAPSFYAQKDYKTPTLASCYSVLMNVGLNALFVFVFKWGAFSIAIATSLSSLFNLWLLKRKRGLIFEPSIVSHFRKVTLVSCSAGGITLLIAHLWKDPTWAIIQQEGALFTRHIGEQLWQCGAFGLLFCASLWAIASLCRVKLRLFS